jgi:hypothetical protein
MARKLLLAVLLLSLVIELGLTGGLLFARETTSKAFGVGLTADTSFLAYILGWLCGFASMMLCLAIVWLWRGDGHYVPLCYLMGIFWIGIGIGIYAGFGKPDNLLIDTLKGCLIVGLTWWSQRSVVR